MKTKIHIQNPVEILFKGIPQKPKYPIP